MRVPVAVQAAEACGGERLVDRGVVAHPRIPLGNGLRELRESIRQGGIDQAGRCRAAPVVKEAHDRRDAELPQAAQPLVRPAPVRGPEAAGRGPFPEHRVPERGDAERGEAVEVVEAVLVPGAADLIDVVVADPVDRALDPAPQLERQGAMHSSTPAGRP